jgi:hypothetical protein
MKDLLFVRMVNAAQNMSLKDNFEFIAFDDITAEHIEEMQETPESLEIWAAIKVPYTGELPDSYKVLNLMIGDWVESNLEKLTPALHDELKKHFEENYPESDASALDQMEDTAIWLDQLDYMPDIDEDAKTMQIEIELVLNAESDGEE